MHITHYGAGVLTIENFLSAEECANYITFGEEIGYQESEVNTLRGARRIEEIRNNERVIFDDPDLATFLYERATSCLPPEIQGWALSGFNERLRFYRYTRGEYFKWHKDGTYVRSDMEESFLTFMIYLNDDFEGGDTQFKWETIKPKQGMVLVFPHRQLHQGSIVFTGIKYVLRTDVMYRNDEVIQPA